MEEVLSFGLMVVVVVVADELLSAFFYDTNGVYDHDGLNFTSNNNPKFKKSIIAQSVSHPVHAQKDPVPSNDTIRY